MNEFKSYQDTKVFEGNYSTEIFETLVGDLDNVRISYSKGFSAPFELRLGKFESKLVYSGSITSKPNLDKPKQLEINDKNSTKVSKPSQAIEININPDIFTFNDIPKLVRDITSVHNKWVEENYKSKGFVKLVSQFFHKNNDIETQQLWQINPGEIIAKRYLSVAQIITKAQDGVGQNSNNTILSIFKDNITDLKGFLKEIAGEYAPDVIDEKSPISHENEEKILQFLRKERDPKSPLRRIKTLTKLVTNNLKSSGSQDLISSIFERAQAEVMRLVDIDELLHNFEKQSKSSIAEFQQTLSEIRDPEVKSKIQIETATYINQFIYNYNLFLHSDNGYKPSQIAEHRYINCVGVAFIQYMIWEKYFGVELIGADTTRHFFNILKLANHTYLRLDGNPVILKDADDKPATRLKDLDTQSKNSKKIFRTGNFEKMFTSSIYTSNGILNITDNPELAEAYNIEALKLNPNSSVIIINLANLYSANLNNTDLIEKNGGQQNLLMKTEKLYLKGTLLDPHSASHLFNYASLLDQYPHLFEQRFGRIGNVLGEIERLYLAAIKLAEENGDTYRHWIKLTLARHYIKFARNLDFATKLLREVLEAKQKDQSIPLYFNEKEIIELITKYEK